MVERSCVLNPQTAIRKNRTNKVHCAGDTERNFEGAVCSNEFRSGKWSPLFLASTVSALHRSAHIWNASHPLLVTYHCWVTVYSPSMEAQKKKVIDTYQTPGIEQGSGRSVVHVSANCAIRAVVFMVHDSWRKPRDRNDSPISVYRPRMEKSHSGCPWTAWCVVNIFHKNGMRPLIISNGTICYSISYRNSPPLYIRIKYVYSVISVKLNWLSGKIKKWRID